MNGKTLLVDEKDLNKDNLLRAIVSAKQKYIAQDNKRLAYSLQCIEEFLPKYPVLAVLEAEHLKMPSDFIKLLRRVFDIKQFK